MDPVNQDKQGKIWVYQTLNKYSIVEKWKMLLFVLKIFYPSSLNKKILKSHYHKYLISFKIPSDGHSRDRDRNPSCIIIELYNAFSPDLLKARQFFNPFQTNIPNVSDQDLLTKYYSFWNNIFPKGSNFQNEQPNNNPEIAAPTATITQLSPPNPINSPQNLPPIDNQGSGTSLLNQISASCSLETFSKFYDLNRLDIYLSSDF